MEEDWKPFEVVEEDGRTILRLHGTEEQRAKVEVDKVHLIMDAIAQGWDIDIEYSDIEGSLSIRVIHEELEQTEGNRLAIKGNVGMVGCNISGSAYFVSAQFSGNVYFESAYFSGNAYFASAHFSGNADFESAKFGMYALFRSAHFSGDANFGGAQFSGNADFRSAHFSGYADFESAKFGRYTLFMNAQFSGYAHFGFAHFSGNAGFGFAHFSGGADFSYAHFSGYAGFANVAMAEPGNFADVAFRENHVIKGLWNVTLGRIEGLHWQATDFSGFNTEKVMDGASNPWLKRYIDDELWIQSWRKRSWWRGALFTIWELTSHCGRSIGLWAFWSVVIAFVFGFLHKGHIEVGSVSNWYTPFYFSVVTFTTLGFGDVTPKDGLGQFWITLEVVLGYVMLGGLISIFANKLARRS